MIASLLKIGKDLAVVKRKVIKENDGPSETLSEHKNLENHLGC